VTDAADRDVAVGLLAPRHRRRRGPRLFATPVEVPRARRATDLLLLLGAMVGLALIGFAAVPEPGFSKAIATLLTSLPDLLDGLWQLVVDLLALLAIVFVAGAVLSKRRGLARDLVLAAGLAVVVWLLIGRLVTGSWPEAWESLRAAEPPPQFPSPRLAIPAAVIITASPHLARPLRRLGRWLLTVSALGVVALAASDPLGALAGVLVGTAAAAIVHLAFGSCGGHPGLDDVRHALAELGVPARTVGAAARQPAGPFVVTADDEREEPLVVKVYGRDAYDTALVTTVWRTLWYREPGSPLRLGRLQQVEHEAFLTLLARQAGVATDAVVMAGATRDDDALLVLRPVGEPLADGAAADDQTAIVAEVWELVRRLRAAGIAHGQFDHEHLVWADSELGLRDFRGATVAPTDVQAHTDEVQAFVTTVLMAGPEVASRAAIDALGPDGLDAVLPFLQPVALTPFQRRALRTADIDLDELRADAAGVAGTEPPDLERLRRVTLGSVIRILLPAVAAFALISGLAGLDFEVLLEELGDAKWWLIVVGLLLAQLPRLTQAVSTLGASPVPLALGPVYALQLAISYINLAVPTAAARMAVNIRFFQRHGVPAGTAVAVGALDGFAGLIVQALLLVVLLVLSPVSLDLQLEEGSGSAAVRLLGLVVVVSMLAIGVVLVVPRLRRFVWGWVRRLASEARGALRGLRSPRRIGLLLGGNIATELLFALALGTFIAAFGHPVGIGELLLINISVGLLSGVIPIPGGIGVVEGGLTFGLVQAGVPEEAAFAAVILYRIGTFYLPPVWGFFALRWLERNKHL
jgi:uncharacterized membrane protein YbhN (UPF0104 family)